LECVARVPEGPTPFGALVAVDSVGTSSIGILGPIAVTVRAELGLQPVGVLLANLVVSIRSAVGAAAGYSKSNRPSSLLAPKPVPMPPAKLTTPMRTFSTRSAFDVENM